ncbi:MAG: glycosyltransferase family 39 protein [Planctomycetaceae bacterium]|nr:glycosyltransferase family 39 protein [Planctomycetaceae bacterium]
MGESGTVLSRKKAAKYFWSFAALWFGIWVALPCLMCAAPSNFDVIEQLILGREWVLGSGHHPPFAFWCIESVYQLCGHVVASSAVCGALASFVGLLAIWRFSRYYVSETKALLIVFASAAYRYLNMGNVNFTTSIPPTVIWCLAIFLLFRAVEDSESPRCNPDRHGSLGVRGNGIRKTGDRRSFRNAC